MKRFNFIDIGTNNGGTAKMMIDIAERLGLDYKLYGFEASLDVYKKCADRFKNNPDVFIINKAIADKEGEMKLFHAKKSLGHSLFSSKKNVAVIKPELVYGIKFSKWLTKNINSDDINICKSNIEGASYYMFHDLIDTNTYKYIDIFCGNQANDVNKIPELADKKDAFFKKISDAGIELHYFSNTKYGTKKGGNVDLEQMLRRLI